MISFASTGTELTRFKKGTLPKLAVGVLLFIPLIYGALYLWAFWTPTEELGNLSVALVNEDEGYTHDGDRIEAGGDVVDELLEGQDLQWHETDAAGARDGVADGTYYFSVTIPKNFSAAAASIDGDDPVKAELGVEFNDSNNFLASTLGGSAMTVLRDAVAKQVSATTADGLLVGIDTLADGIRTASDGAGDLDDGAQKINDGAGSLTIGLGDLAGGASTLAAGAQTLADGSATLSSGVDQAAAGAGSLASGAAKLDSGAAQLATGTRAVSDGAAQLKSKTTALPGSATALNDGAQSLSDGASSLNDGAQALKAGTPTLKSTTAAIAQLAAANPNMTLAQLNQALAAQGGSLQAVADGAARVDAGASALADGAATLSTGAGTLAGGTASLSEQVPTLVAGIGSLADGAASAATGAGTLATGAHDLSSGASTLSGALSDARPGAAQLAAGAATLATGAGSLSDGATTAHDGATTLSEGTTTLADGTTELRTKLADGAAAAPDYSQQHIDSATEVLSEPVVMAKTYTNEAKTFGEGFAPFFMALAAFVGALITWLILRALPTRALASRTSGLRAALTGFLPAAAIGLGQVIIMMAVLVWGIGLEPVYLIGTTLFLYLTTLAFLALQQMFIVLFGSATGRVISLVLLMVQLSSSGGTYPVETTPMFFQIVHPYMPATYVVNGLRELITGGIDARFWIALAYMIGLLVLSLAVSAYAAGRQKVWSMKRLSPELSI